MTDDHDAPIPPALDRAEFRRGLVAVAPFLVGVPPFAIAFAVGAREAGFSPWQTQALSMLVFAGSAQLAVVALVATGGGAVVVVLTALMLNLRHVLYGLSLATWIDTKTRPRRAILAAFLIDESYGLAMRSFLQGRGSGSFLLGASLGLYVTFALSTFAGSLVGPYLPDPAWLGLDFIVPLTFLALLVPLLRTGRDLAVAVVAGIAVLGLGHSFAGGVAMLLATIGAAVFGVVVERRWRREKRLWTGGH